MFCLPDGNIFAKMRVEYTFFGLIFYAESEFRVRNKKKPTWNFHPLDYTGRCAENWNDTGTGTIFVIFIKFVIPIIPI